MINKIALLSELIKMADKLDRAEDETSADLVESIMKKILAMEEKEQEILVDSDEADVIAEVLRAFDTSEL
jgi:hypothetical protein